MGPERLSDKDQELTFDQALASFLNSEKFSRYSSNTKGAYTGDIRDFGEFLEEHGVKDLGELSPSNIIDFLNQFTQKTASRKSCALKAFFDHIKVPVINEIPAENIPRIVEEISPLNYLSLQKQQELLEVAGAKSTRNQALIAIILATGANIQEILDLEDKDIQKVSHFQLSLQLKSRGKPRIVTLDSKNSEIVADYLKSRRPSRKLFVNVSSSRKNPDKSLSRQNVWRDIKEYGKEIGRPDLSPRVLRNTFIMNFKGSIRQLADVLGTEYQGANVLALHRKATLRNQPTVPTRAKIANK